jgi:hypothetical protein
MDELSSAGLVHEYVAGQARQRLAYIVNFRKHQKINRPNPGKLPAPSLTNEATAAMYLRRDGFLCHLCLEPIPTVRMLPPLDPYDPNCGPDMTPLNASLDHVVPRSLGGSDYPSNIRMAHVGCNKGRSNRGIEQFSRPKSVDRCLWWMRTNQPDSLGGALSNAVSESLFDSVSDALPEGKGREGKGEDGEEDSPPKTSKLGFAEFYAVYPKRVARQAAEKAWGKAIKGGANPEVVILAAKKFAATRAGQDPKFTPYPATWLNRGSWEDEDETPHLRVVGGYQPFVSNRDPSAWEDDL